MKVTFEELKQQLRKVLLQLSFTEKKADICATVFAANSRDGVYSHGLNRFPLFVEYVKEELVNIHAEPELVDRNGLLEVWDGHRAPGIYNGTLCMDRAIALARENGIGCVSIRNTSHWMRGGTYGWQAAEAGCIGICFTNAIAAMAPWGGTSPRLGNNPLVIAVPRKEGPVVLDMALSQYSYGKMQQYELQGQTLPFAGGYDAEGKLTHDPAAIRQTMRALPIGLWKGAGLSLMLDIILTALSGGLSTRHLSANKNEAGVSQCYICLYRPDLHASLIEEIIAYTKSSAPAEPGGRVSYPGENTLLTRQRNEKEGIPVNEEIWKQVLKM